MIIQFCRYFAHYIFFAKTKQRLLLLSIVGLFISSFSLLVLQSTMGGLQGKLIERSKRVLGSATLTLLNSEGTEAHAIEEQLSRFSIQASAEREVELLLKNGNLVTPVIAHGVELKNLPQFLNGQEFRDLLVPQDIAFKLNLSVGKQTRLIAPGTVDTVFEDIPRMATLFVDGIISTDVPEVDMYHIWVRSSLIQNLIKKHGNNKWRLYGEFDVESLKSSFAKTTLASQIQIKTWEEENNTLVWALRLETMVMIFLFVAMTMLVALCITSGLLIFFDKIKKDLVSFWILGSSKTKLTLSAFAFLNMMGLVTVGLGIVFALLFLWSLDKFGGNIMPEVFIDRKIPIHITMKGILISFGVPFLISMIFSWLSLLQFKAEEEELLEEIRTIG